MFFLFLSNFILGKKITIINYLIDLQIDLAEVFTVSYTAVNRKINT